MNKNLSYYVKTYKALNKEFCNQVIEEIEQYKWMKHSYHDEREKKELFDTNELDVAYNTNSSSFLMEVIYSCISNYILNEKDNFVKKYFSGWNGFSNVRFNRYGVGQKMNLHCDHITTLFEGKHRGIPTLTVLGFLNNNYEGGDFIMWEDVKMNLEPGSILVFPSNFLYPHRVEPVKSGTKYSFVSWVW